MSTLLEITKKFDIVYFDNCALRYKARNMPDKQVFSDSRYVQKYIDYVRDVKQILSSNGKVLIEILEELKGYVKYLKKHCNSDELFNEYKSLLTECEPVSIKNISLVQSDNDKLSEIDIKLLSVTFLQKESALITNDIDLINEAVNHNLKNRIVTRFNFKDYYILEDRYEQYFKSKKNG